MNKMTKPRKEKGGAEKARVRKRKAAEAAAAKCAKLSSYFGKATASASTSTAAGGVEETGKEAKASCHNVS